MITLIRSEAGFTLVELLVVLIILGIISTIAVVAFGSSHKDASRSACKTNYQTSLLAIQSYQSDHEGALPSSLHELEPTYINPGLIDTSAFSLTMQSFPGFQDIYSILVGVINSGTVLHEGTFSASSNGYSFNVPDTSDVTIGQTVVGSGIPSIFNTSANGASGSNSILVADATGIVAGMKVQGFGIAEGTMVDATYATGSTTVPLSNPVMGTLSTTPISFGALPTVSDIQPGVVILSTGSNPVPSGVSSPVADKKYTLAFGSSLLPGTAPTACLNL